MYLSKHDDISARLSVPCRKSAGTFSRPFVIEPAYEGDKGGHIGPMVIDISDTNHV